MVLYTNHTFFCSLYWCNVMPCRSNETSCVQVEGVAVSGNIEFLVTVLYFPISAVFAPKAFVYKSGDGSLSY